MKVKREENKLRSRRVRSEIKEKKVKAERMVSFFKDFYPLAYNHFENYDKEQMDLDGKIMGPPTETPIEDLASLEVGKLLIVEPMISTELLWYMVKVEDPQFTMDVMDGTYEELLALV